MDATAPKTSRQKKDILLSLVKSTLISNVDDTIDPKTTESKAYKSLITTPIMELTSIQLDCLGVMLNLYTVAVGEGGHYANDYKLNHLGHMSFFIRLARSITNDLVDCTNDCWLVGDKTHTHQQFHIQSLVFDSKHKSQGLRAVAAPNSQKRVVTASRFMVSSSGRILTVVIDHSHYCHSLLTFFF